MEAAPPSYDYATSRDHWSLIAPYIRSEDLFSACLVNRAWHRSFASQLWGNPSHFMQLLEDPWLGLRKFERIIQAIARFELRQLTHTLQVPVNTRSLHEEMYSSKWLFNMLSRLPRLQCLLVPNVSSFDHEALSTLRRSILPNYEESESSNHVVSLSANYMRLLDASNCRNVTSTALRIALEMFPNLMYLDLSGVPAASFAEILPKLSHLRDLKVLNLRRVRLNDAMLSILASCVAQRVRCLDIRENPTTEKSFVKLLENCFATQLDDVSSDQNSTHNGGEPSDEPPSYQRQHSSISVQGQDFGDSLFKALTHGPVNRLALEDASEIGITHLRMSMKSITAQNLFTSFRCQHLQYLDIDCGNVEFGPQINIMHQSPQNLEYLRVHHTLVTARSTRSPYLPEHAKTSPSLRDVAEKRRVRAQDGRTNFQNITASLPHLRTLVLTGVPMETGDSSLVPRIIDLLRNCALNSTLATAQARIEHSSKSGWTGDTPASRRRVKALFPLETVVLEVIPAKVDPRKQVTKGWNYREDTKAVTEDRDSEALWTAAGTDFSFFDNENYATEPDVRLDNIRVNASGPSTSKANSQLRASTSSVIDTVNEIIVYRKASRNRCENEQAFGNDETYHEFWNGVVSIARN